MDEKKEVKSGDEKKKKRDNELKEIRKVSLKDQHIQWNCVLVGMSHILHLSRAFFIRKQVSDECESKLAELWY